MTGIASLGLIEVAEQIRAGSLSSVEVTAAVLTEARAAQGRCNCFLEIDEDAALLAAAAADRARDAGEPLGVLHGVPLAHKDMFDDAGHAIRYGSRVRGVHVPSATAAVLERLRSAGAIRIGALNMAEFALGPTGHNAIFGDCRNALDPAYMAGGSSSGSGAAVAARASFASLGSDTGGSVRIPAACNGVVGLREPRLGHWRISTHSSGLQRRRRSQADLWPDFPLRQHEALAFHRRDRPHYAQRCRLRADAGRTGRP